MRVEEIHGIRVLLCPLEGPGLRGDRDAIALINAAFEQRAKVVVVPQQRFDPEFFRLATRLAGEFVQKFVNYQIRLAVLGDVSGYLQESSALRDFVRESNRTSNIWFVADLKELAMRVRGAGQERT